MYVCVCNRVRDNYDCQQDQNILWQVVVLLSPYCNADCIAVQHSSVQLPVQWHTEQVIVLCIHVESQPDCNHHVIDTADVLLPW